MIVADSISRARFQSTRADAGSADGVTDGEVGWNARAESFARWGGLRDEQRMREREGSGV